MAATFASAQELVTAFPDYRHRAQAASPFPGFAADDAIFDSGNQNWELWSNASLAAWLAEYGCRQFGNPKILDLGCGPAHLFFFFRRLGLMNYLGVDGNPLFIKLNPYLLGLENHFRILNLAEKIQFGADGAPVTFDMICSFEVLEHLTEDAVDNFLWTIRKHMHAHSIVFCTASLQNDIDVHVLVRPRAWWYERFAQAGLTPVSNEPALRRELSIREPFNWGGERTNIFVLAAA